MSHRITFQEREDERKSREVSVPGVAVPFDSPRFRTRSLWRRPALEATNASKAEFVAYRCLGFKPPLLVDFPITFLIESMDGSQWHRQNMMPSAVLLCKGELRDGGPTDTHRLQLVLWNSTRFSKPLVYQVTKSNAIPNNLVDGLRDSEALYAQISRAGPREAPDDNVLGTFWKLRVTPVAEVHSEVLHTALIGLNRSCRRLQGS
ncbi:hypothetical protein FKP32DRAFT_258759 [Trametes sanguinea]|nr:hypothetical protein FKP32DRAFT_258759 [Trametes sanguinea]